MAILKIEIDEESDLPELEARLTRMGLKYEIEDDDNDWGDLPEEAIEGIKARMEDIKAGRTYSHEYVMAEMNKKLKQSIEK